MMMTVINLLHLVCVNAIMLIILAICGENPTKIMLIILMIGGDNPTPPTPRPTSNPTDQPTNPPNPQALIII